MLFFIFSEIFRIVRSIPFFNVSFFVFANILFFSHIPSYILAAFVKKLSRILLQAPLSHQFVLLTLIRNLITRHNVLLPLIHRDEPGKHGFIVQLRGHPFITIAYG